MNTFTPTWNHLRDTVYSTRHLPQYPPETIAKHQGYEIPEVKNEPTSANS